ncbi:MAG: hypothetical protein QOG03_2487 [Actinomycetota bacterium]|jgi:hypothetical protein|nr:hypothetical protein [Actinomycetota bacterium]
MDALDDGRYDVFVVDVEEDDENDVTHLDLTITSGARKGEVVRVRATNLRRDPVALLGLPGSMEVIDGRPSVTFD